MATTPSPRGRIHTPPTPLHGAKHDTWEPYSPRRSSRVAAQRSKQALQSPQCQAARALSPKHRISRTPRSSQTFSPPSSPSSPPNSLTLEVSKTRKNAKSRLPQKPGQRRSSPASDVEVDRCGASSTQLRPTITDPFSMLPTPAKTPRKRHVPEATLKSTARVLFPGRPATIDDAMPSPRKAKKSKMPSFTFGGLTEGGEDEASSNAIPIYTDTKERLPSVGSDENNPFLSKNAATKKKSLGLSVGKRKPKRGTRESEMMEAAKNDEGMIYVFRGRKIFRKFQDATSEEFEDTLSDLETRRKAGHAADRPLTRSSYKPRLLFPTEEQRRTRDAADEADEEALTDIDVPQPSLNQTRADSELAPAEDPPQSEAVTPVDQHFHPPGTPPSTGRTTRSSPKKSGNGVQATEEPLAAEETGNRAKAAKKLSPFATWSRTKPSAARAVSRGTKREGEPIEREEGTSKRTRSGTVATIGDMKP